MQQADAAQADPGLPTAVPPARIAPPTAPSPLPAARSKWPTVVGIVCIVFGAGGVLTGVWNIASYQFLKRMPALAGGEAMTEVYARWTPQITAAGVVGVAVAGMLLWGGVLLTRRSARARGVLLAWAALRSAQGVWAGVVAALMQQEVVSAVMNAQSGAGAGGVPPGMPAIMGGSVAVMTALFAIVWALLLPGFIVVWFMMGRVAAEVRSWRGGAGGMQPV